MVGKLSCWKIVDRQHSERVGEVFCCVNRVGERGDGSGREELGWVEEETEQGQGQGRDLKSSASRRLSTQ
jgi:hypothetical protein